MEILKVPVVAFELLYDRGVGFYARYGISGIPERARV